MGILFKPELAAKVMDGSKTQTRRLVQPGDEKRFSSVFAINDSKPPRKRWQIDQTYAVIPGMYNKGIGRIRILKIEYDPDVRLISEEDAHAEGFGNAVQFLRVWVSLCDKTFAKDNDHIWERPANLYNAWKLTFEVAK